jgi:hypothetical protein
MVLPFRSPARFQGVSAVQHNTIYKMLQRHVHLFTEKTRFSRVLLRKFTEGFHTENASLHASRRK